MVRKRHVKKIMCIVITLIMSMGTLTFAYGNEAYNYCSNECVDKNGYSEDNYNEGYKDKAGSLDETVLLYDYYDEKYEQILPASTVLVYTWQQLVQAVANAGNTPTTIMLPVQTLETTGTLVIPRGANITLVGRAGGSIQAIGNNPIFIVNGNLTLDDPSLTRALPYYTDCDLTGDFRRNNSGTAVHVNSSGTFTLSHGFIESKSGTGVVVDGGAFVMNGGMIQRIDGVAVEIENGGTFVMDGGEIRDNDGFIGIVRVETGSTFTMNNGSISSNYWTSPVSVSGTFIMNGGQIDNNRTFESGGGVAVGSTGLFTMNGGRIFDNHHSATRSDGYNFCGGGAVTIFGGTFIMNRGEIFNNSTTFGAGGGGVHLHTGTLIMNGGEIRNNRTIAESPTHDWRAAAHGGGVLITGGTFHMVGGVIRNNTADGRGGAIHIASDLGVAYPPINGFFSMTGGARISGNITYGNGGGGGIFVSDCSEVEISDAYIINNSAPNGHGGGIYTEDATLQNLTIADTVEFSGNTASIVFEPPANAGDFVNIGYANTSILYSGGFIHPLNNFDINFAGDIELALFSITYNANNGEGDPHSDFVTGDDVTLTVRTMAEAGISAPSGRTFQGWNTMANGGGVAHAPGTEITLTGNLTLYAQWTTQPTPLWGDVNSDGVVNFMDIMSLQLWDAGFPVEIDLSVADVNGDSIVNFMDIMHLQLWGAGFPVVLGPQP
jgi:uncharacterized repeat protein (TIGR02543 family)